MEELNLELNHTYLLRYGRGYTISSATVLMITDKAYRIRWNNGLNTTDTWELKSYIDSQYSIVEDVSDYMKSEEVKKPKTLYYDTIWKDCPECQGNGWILCNESTSRKKTCTLCCGSKRVVDEIKII